MKNLFKKKHKTRVEIAQENIDKILSNVKDDDFATTLSNLCSLYNLCQQNRENPSMRMTYMHTLVYIDRFIANLAAKRI